MDEFVIKNGEFGVKSGGTIKIIDDKTSLIFKRIGENLMEMRLTLAFQEDDENVVIGPKKSEELKFDKLGAFEFNKPNFKGDGLNSLNIFIVDDTEVVKIRSKSLDLDMQTNGKKREHGIGLIVKQSQNSQ